MKRLALAIETSTTVGSVALGENETVLGEILLDAHTRHAEALLPAVDELLQSCGAGPADLACIAVGGGPGSFTGLRIAAATAKGLVHALAVPLYSYSGLLVAAASSGFRGRPVCALFDARRSEVYAGSYIIGSAIETTLAPVVCHIDELLSSMDARGALFTGEGAVKHAGALEAFGGIVLAADTGIPRASTLLVLLREFPDAGRVESPARWEPDYLRASSAERGRSA